MRRIKTWYEIMRFSVSHENVNTLMWKTHSMLENAPEPEAVETMPVYRASQDPRAFTIEQTEEAGWSVAKPLNVPQR